MGKSVAERSKRPPLDPEYQQLIDAGELALLRTILPDDIPELRREFTSAPIEQLIGDRPIKHENFIVPESGMPVSVLTPIDTAIRGWVFAVHGGGLIVGDRYTGVEFAFEWIEQLGLAVVTPEYRLAPEYPYPAALTDCDQALSWTRGNVAAGPRLPLVLSGVSAGGALAVALALTLRDRGDPPVSGLLLQAPMLDHRNDSVSSGQFSGTGQWDRESNDTGWGAYLDPSAAELVTPYMSPALATDVSGLPRTFIDVGSAELFRDEDVAFASALWSAGVDAELIVWPGGIHGFDRVVPETRLARAARTVRNEWLARVIDSTQLRE